MSTFTGNEPLPPTPDRAAVESTYYAMNPWWEGGHPEVGIPRPAYLTRLQVTPARKQINLVIGGRRVGKTTLVRQLVAGLLQKGVAPRDILYLALDHPRLARTAIAEHLRFFRGLFQHDRSRELWLFFDEVQESPDWEGELKAVYDLEHARITCTGSTAALLAGQGGKLTGRQTLLEVYPLSFPEFLQFRGYAFGRAEDYRFVAAAEEYLSVGGYPEQVLQPSDAYLAQLLQDIVARDLVRLAHVRRPEMIDDLLRLIAGGTGSRTSYSRLAKALGVAVDTVKDYLSHLTGAYLIRSLPKWTPSHTERVYAPRKVYLLDNGFRTLLAGAGDLGAKAETAVFGSFVRRGVDCGYYVADQREVDFVSGSRESPTAVEVKYEDRLDWDSRRFDGVRAFLREHSACRAVTVVTRDFAGEQKAGDATVTAVPLWRYLLDE